MAKTTKRPTSRQTELPEELALRKLKARAEAQVIRAAMKAAKAQLSTYASAKVGRQTKDWRAPLGSADAAILEDADRLNARARQLVRDSWIARAAVRAKSRNVVGQGIVPIPAARIGKDEFKAFNEANETLFWDWASDRSACDVEGRRTFWQIQTLCVEEKFIVGEHFIVWSYQPNPHFVGLQLQCFEPEQLETSIQSHEGNEVRRGIEVDRLGRAVAYHFFQRTPNDYLGTSTESVRIPANRVLHYFRADRSQQSHGVTDLAPVMMDIRDLSGMKDAQLFRKKMEACIGFIIKKNIPTPLGSAPGVTPASGDGTTLRGGERAIDMAPGMVPELMPGEDIQPFIPSSNGTDYEPFNEATIRGIGAGIGLSYGAITRKSDGNYSAARQDMLEDERELGPDQDMLIDVIVKGIYELFTAFAVAEGRLPITVEQFQASRRTFLEAEYVTPVRPWIDPEKEANAAEKMIQLRLRDRGEIRAKLGGRYNRTLQRIATLRDEAKAQGIVFEEDVVDPPAFAAPVPQPPPPAPMAARLAARAAPGYGPARIDEQRCGTCRYLLDGRCAAYEEPTTPFATCDAWEAPALTDDPAGASRVIQPAGPAEGDRPFDQTSARDEV
jgi:lambda family phage portal protein